ncbi:hypothetical protein RugamoR64_48090 [Duganella rhizosphaerae]
MVLTTVFTAGSITHTLAPMLLTVAEEWLRIPENIDVICTITMVRSAWATALAMPCGKKAIHASQSPSVRVQNSRR